MAWLTGEILTGINNAQRMHALIIDLDGVGGNELQSLFLRIDRPEGSIFLFLNLLLLF